MRYHFIVIFDYLDNNSCCKHASLLSHQNNEYPHLMELDQFSHVFCQTYLHHNLQYSCSNSTMNSNFHLLKQEMCKSFTICDDNWRMQSLLQNNIGLWLVALRISTTPLYSRVLDYDIKGCSQNVSKRFAIMYYEGIVYYLIFGQWLRPSTLFNRTNITH